MNTKVDYIHFDALTAPLQDSNLIEASAGTGKTYSIAILVLRLVLEKRLSIKDILMVTFTKAAVAELEERIRLFMRLAYKTSQFESISDKSIEHLVEQAMESSSPEEVQQCLRDAMLFLDEISVLTIHSFCQQTLNEFAFETKQLFGAEMLADIRPIIEEELNKYWRKHITTLPESLLLLLWHDGLKDGLMNAVAEHMSGKKYCGYEENGVYEITTEELNEWCKAIEEHTALLKPLTQKVHDYINDNREELASRCEKNAYAKKGLLHLLHSSKEFEAEIRNRRDKQYVQKLFPEILSLLDDCDKAGSKSAELVQHILMRLYCFAIQQVSKSVRQFKLSNNLLSYDDMICNLHSALVAHENPRLVAALQGKYKAIFVDEFQDTDRQQYEIFDKAFGKDTILFYIGDPKQSIYAWRKADIFTYFKAREGVANVYGMNKNYRSSAPLIEAMNRFFLPKDDFDTFAFSNSTDAIKYINVETPEPNTKGLCYKDGIPEVPISVFSCASKDDLSYAAALQVASLLQDGFTTGRQGNAKPVKPSDIGILVRTAQQGREAKAALGRLGIPAVTIDDAKVLQSDEAIGLLYVMEAIISPDRSTINRALLSPFTALNREDILKLDDETALSCFTNYRNRWQDDGIYTAIMDFLADFSVREKLLAASTESGERMLTNLLQVTELVHQVQSRKNLSMIELIAWLRRGIDGMATEGDEYEQRVENDEEAVKIVTIHKSKGLEYKIVLAPFLDFVPRKAFEFLSFRDPESGDYVCVESNRITDQQRLWQLEQEEQENRRLLYVAITRAVFKCYLFKCESKYYINSTLSFFLNALRGAEQDLICFEQQLPALPKGQYAIAKKQTAKGRPAVYFTLKQPSWRMLSYSGLAAKGDRIIRKRPQKQEDAYDNFIFHDLKRGKKTGDLLHFILERIDFGNDARWNDVLTDALRRFMPAQKDAYQPMLLQLLQQLLHTPITIGDTRFPLASVAWNKHIPEFEFDFPVSLFSLGMLQELSDENKGIRIKSDWMEVEGVMNGLMDLFFEHGGKYYILDWKSTYLGDTIDAYSKDALAAAMSEENYHLQYLIYCLAAKKYLESRLDAFDYDAEFGGVIYLFVRGVRNGSDTGIYTCKPALEKIEKLESILQQKHLNKTLVE